MKVAICVPVYGETKGLFTKSLADMLIWTMSRGNDRKPRLSIGTNFLQGCSVIDLAREFLAVGAMNSKSDYLLWLDADQTFPPTILVDLLAHGLPFVGCNYRKRSHVEHASSAMIKRNGELWPIEAKTCGVEPVDSIGFGAVLIAARVFASIPERPWFQLRPNCGEDAYFCEKAASAGFRPHVDHSIKVGHVAETVLML